MPFTDVMPRTAPHQFHQVAAHSDRLTFLDEAQRQRFDSADINARQVDDDLVMLHWPDPHRNGYNRVKQAGGKSRPMAAVEWERPDVQWGLAGVQSWLDGHGNSPLTYAQALGACKRRGIDHPVIELKTLITPELAAKLVDEARRQDMPPWFKGLVWLGESSHMARLNCQRIIEAGGQFALIFGGKGTRRPPADWADWPVKPTRVWGAAKGSKWPGVGPRPAPAPTPKPTPKPEVPVVFKAPSPPYVGPAAHTSSGDNKPITRIVIHSTVSACVPGGARAIGRYFQSPNAGGSAHYIVDPSEVVQSVFDSKIAWHAPPNAHSLGIEMCDTPGPVPNDPPTSARFKAAKRAWRWTKPNQQKVLDRAAKLTAELCLAYDVPVVFLSAADLRAGKHGITTHANVSQAFKQSTHWDPGFWPRRSFMAKVRKYVREAKQA